MFQTASLLRNHETISLACSDTECIFQVSQRAGGESDRTCLPSKPTILHPEIQSKKGKANQCRSLDWEVVSAVGRLLEGRLTRGL